MATKTQCPITREAFATVAKMLVLDVRKQGDADAFQTLRAVPKSFSTGSIGWNCNDKVTVELLVDGKPTPVLVQVGLNMTIVGSKEMPLEKAAA